MNKKICQEAKEIHIRESIKDALGISSGVNMLSKLLAISLFFGLVSCHQLDSDLDNGDKQIRHNTAAIQTLNKSVDAELSSSHQSELRFGRRCTCHTRVATRNQGCSDCK